MRSLQQQLRMLEEKVRSLEDTLDDAIKRLYGSREKLKEMESRRCP
ncbi:unnamed protein product, partial [Urochloa humidicola]